MPAQKDRYYMGVVDVDPDVLTRLTSILTALESGMTLVGPQGDPGDPGPQGDPGPPGPGFLGGFARKIADQVVTNSVALVNDAHLALAVGAGETWVLEGWLVYDAHGTADIKFGLVVPDGSIGVWGLIPQQAAGGGLQACDVKTFAEAQLAAGAGVGAAQAVGLRGLVVVGGSAGLVRLQFAQNTANANPSTLRTFSYLLGTRVAS